MLHPPGLYYVKKPKSFVILSSDKSSERNLSCFFDIIKPRRMEHLQSEEPFSSDPYFSTKVSMYQVHYLNTWHYIFFWIFSIFCWLPLVATGNTLKNWQKVERHIFEVLIWWLVKSRWSVTLFNIILWASSSVCYRKSSKNKVLKIRYS